jgi:hypothetical protein
MTSMLYRPCLVMVLACNRSSEPAPVGVVPRVTTPIKVDGEWNEPDWSKHALRGQFLGDDHQLSRPTSEVRLLHDDAHLFVGLYAADDNIQTTDAFELELGGHTWTISAVGKIDPPIEGATIGVDRDGTIDDPSNNDEEWVIELAIPLAATSMKGAERTHVRASRCDVPKHQQRRCGSWTGAVTLE